MRILVTGATGFIGHHLLSALSARGDSVAVVARSPEKAIRLPGKPAVFQWAGAEAPFPHEALDGVDAVVNLLGEPIKGRFSESHKQRIFKSRILGTRKLVEAIAQRDDRPRKLISASGIGYYGDRGDEILTEQSSPGDDFLAQVCKAWEHEAAQAEKLGVRVSRIRTGLVLGREGGALQEMLPPFRLGLGGPLAGGKDWMPWIHIADWVGLVLHVLDAGQAQAYNATAPNPVPNQIFTKALGRALRRPAFMPVPKLALDVLLGREMANVALTSDRALPKQALDEGFQFQFTSLDDALNDLLRQ